MQRARCSCAAQRLRASGPHCMHTLPVSHLNVSPMKNPPHGLCGVASCYNLRTAFQRPIVPLVLVSETQSSCINNCNSNKSYAQQQFVQKMSANADSKCITRSRSHCYKKLLTIKTFEVKIFVAQFEYCSALAQVKSSLAQTFCGSGCQD